jgi:DNA topoisomerase-1
VALFQGRYGPYVSHDGVIASLPRDADPETFSLEQALPLLEARREKSPNRARKTAKPAAAKPTKTAKSRKAKPAAATAASGAEAESSKSARAAPAKATEAARAPARKLKSRAAKAKPTAVKRVGAKTKTPATGSAKKPRSGAGTRPG